MKKITFKYVPILALVLLFLATGQVNAGDVTTLYAKALTADDTYSAWSADNLATEGWDPTTNLTVDSSTKGLTLKTTLGTSGKSTTSSSSYKVNYTANSILTYDFIWYDSEGTRSGTYDYSQLNICDNLYFKNTTNGTLTIYFNGTAYSTTYSKKNTYLTVHIKIDTSTLKITAFTIYDGSTALITLNDLVDTQKRLTSGSTFTYLTLLAYAAKNTFTTTTALKQLQIQQETQVVTTASYTVNYTYGGKTVKTVSGNANVGTIIPVLTAMNGDGDNSGIRYVIEAAAAPSQEIVDGTNTLSVPVRPVYQATLNVYRSLNGTAEKTPFITKTLTETDTKDVSYTYAFPYYYNDGTNYYMATLKGDDNNQFGETGTFTNGETITKTVEYKTADDVVYFADYDDDYNNNNNISYSNGGYKVYAKDIMIGTALTAGSYYITINQSSGYNSSLYTDNTNAATTLFTTTNSVRTGLFTLAADVATNTLEVSNGSNMRLDYILIKKATVSATVTDAGFATFSSDKALDFTNVTDISAYIATSIDDNHNLVMTKVTGAVPASTGLLLKGTVGTAVTTTIPVAVSATAPTTNYFVATVAATDVAASTASTYHYFLMNGTKGIGFYNLDAAKESAAGKAYLETTSALATASTASPINMIFNDGSTTTGINTVNTVQQASNKIYDLCGQEVSAPVKGLYIMNGKKVIIK